MAKKQNFLSKITRKGFTIVELLVIIVVIGILASITVIAYGSWQKAVAETQIKTDLIGAKTAMENYRSFNGKYPDNFSVIDFKPSDGVSITGSSVDGGLTFTLTAVSDRIKEGYYTIANNSGPVYTVLTCSDGFVKVPGSSTYGTRDFCVMKYEARKDSNNKAVSVATGLPWVNISQNNATTAAAAACYGCHLITEAEWMTLAQNILSVPSNWTGNAVGSGSVYIGFVDNTLMSSAPVAADSNDSNGYINTKTTSGTRRRTLTLTNGSVIWDLSGNVQEWTSGQTKGGQPGRAVDLSKGIDDWYFYHPYTAMTAPGSLSVNIYPSGTGLPGASTWNDTNGMGSVYSNSKDTTNLVGFKRGGFYHKGGILELYMASGPTNYNNYTGFRVTR